MLREREVGEVVQSISDVKLSLRGDWGDWTVHVTAGPGDGGTVGTIEIHGPWNVSEVEGMGISASMLGGEWSELPHVLRTAAIEIERATPRVNES